MLVIGSKSARLALQMIDQVLSHIGSTIESRATHSAAIDGEVDAGVPVSGADDLILNSIKAERSTSEDVGSDLEEPVKSTQIGDARDRIRIDDTMQHQAIVGVDPIGQLVKPCLESMRVGVGTHPCNGIDIRVQVLPIASDSRVVDLSLCIDVFAQHGVEQIMTEGRAGFGAGGFWDEGLLEDDRRKGESKDMLQGYGSIDEASGTLIGRATSAEGFE